MSRVEASSLGGKARAKIQKEEAENKYYENPNYCKYCGKIIEVNGRKVSEIRVKKFCNHSCSAKYSNCKRKKDNFCKVCGKKIESKTAKYCLDCRKISRNWKNSKIGFNEVAYREKGELFKNSTSWQVARNAICKNARHIYWNNNSIKSCKICGYKYHIEVCHIKPVSEFDDKTLISEINNIDNLVGLCPNHHWEFDNGILNLSTLKL